MLKYYRYTDRQQALGQVWPWCGAIPGFIRLGTRPHLVTNLDTYEKGNKILKEKWKERGREHVGKI